MSVHPKLTDKGQLKRIKYLQVYILTVHNLTRAWKASTIMATKTETLVAIERDLFRQDDCTDPRSRKRIVPMQVLNMSFPRTGTTYKPSPLYQACLQRRLFPFHANFPLPTQQCKRP
jgi:hypothetical protein